ncbi:MAG TPA: metallophosphoesterase [Solirubrobacteraceae bacterium]|jgi:Icc-related predicted phosphoesterase
MPDSVRIAAAGDVHCRPAQRDHAIRAFAGLDAKADVLLLAGDLTTHGQPEQAEVLAEACAPLDIPIVAVLGNHDWHCNTVDECLPIWEEAGIRILDRSHVVLDVGGVEVGVAGVKGFVGGFPGSHLPDFGEPSLRGIYAEAGEEAAALDRGLRAIAQCPVRVALLHYAPTPQTLVGEPEPIWTYLGTDRLAPPIAEHEPDLVLHGHAHHGTFEGRIGNVPVYNVSVPVMGQDYWVFELSGVERVTTPIH